MLDIFSHYLGVQAVLLVEVRDPAYRVKLRRRTALQWSSLLAS